jgi:hypothetical protein
MENFKKPFSNEKVQISYKLLLRNPAEAGVKTSYSVAIFTNFSGKPKNQVFSDRIF